MRTFNQKLTPGSINHDLAPDKRPPNVAFDVINFEAFLTDRGLSFKVAKGTKELPGKPLDTFIVGEGSVEGRMFLFATTNYREKSTKLDKDFLLEVTDSSVYIIQEWSSPAINLSTLYPITSIGSSEGVKANLYWVDGLNQTRVVDVNSKSIHNTPVDFSKPIEGDVSIRAEYSHNAGAVDAVVQYGYLLYNLGGSSSKISPFTPELQISKLGVSAKVTMSINNTNYDYVKIFRVKYDAYKGAPLIELVLEQSIERTNDVIKFYDDGAISISTISIEEFLELGSDLIVPRSLAQKKQRLFLSNFKTLPFRINGGSSTRPYFEARAFGYRPLSSGGVLGPTTPIPNSFMLDYEVNIKYTEGPNVSEDIDITFLMASHYEVGRNFTIMHRGVTFSANMVVEVLKSDNSGAVESFIITQNHRAFTKSYPFAVKIQLATELYTEVGTATLIRPSNFSAVYEFIPFVTDNGNFKYSVTGIDPSIVATIKNHTGNSRSSVNISANKIFYVLNDLLGFEFFDGAPSTKFKVKLPVTGTRQEYLSSVVIKDTAGITTQYSPNAVPPTHDAINPDTSIYKYTSDGVTLGVEGPNVLIKIDYTTDFLGRRYPKMGETYRVGVVYKNTHGNESEVLWVADILMPYHLRVASINTFKGVIKHLPPGAVSARFVYVERKLSDKSIIAQGVLQPLMEYKSATSVLGVTPYPYLKRVLSDSPVGGDDELTAFNVDEGYKDGNDFTYSSTFKRSISVNAGAFNVLSPETTQNRFDLPADSYTAVGLCPIVKATSILKVKNKIHPNDPLLTNEVTVDKYTGNVLKHLGKPTGVNISKSILDGWYEAQDPRTLVAEFFLYSNGFIPAHVSKHSLKSCKFLDYDNTVVSNSVAISNHIDYTKFNADTVSGPSSQASNLRVETASSYILESDNSGWGLDYDLAFKDKSASGPNYVSKHGYIPLVDIGKDIHTSQYGGQSYFSKSNNLYIVSSEEVKENQPTTLFMDTYTGLFKLPVSTSARDYLNDWSHGIFTFLEVFMESSISPEEFNKKAPKGTNSTGLGSTLGVEVKQYYEYKNVFSQIPTATLASALPFNFIEVTEYPTRIVSTDNKFLGETTDRWTNIKTGTYIDLEVEFGSVNALVRVVDSVIAFQDRGIAVVEIYPRSQTSSSTGTISLGRGKVLDDYKYVKIDSGTTRASLVAVIGGKVFYVDTWNKCIAELTEGDLSGKLGFNTLAQNSITNNKKINVAYSGNNWVYLNTAKHEVHFKVGDGPVLVYNTLTSFFTHKRTYEKGLFFASFSTKVIISTASGIYEADKGSIGDYLGGTRPASVTYFLEPLPGVDKVFDAIEVSKEGVSNFDKIKVTSPSRTSTLVPTSFKTKFDIFRAHLPRVVNSRDRWRVRNIKLFLEYNGKTEFFVDFLKIIFSIKKM